MYVHGNRDLARTRDRAWEDLMNQPLELVNYVVGLLATTLIYNAQYIKYIMLRTN